MTHTTTVLVWRRHTDGAEFAGTFVRDVPEHHSIVARALSDGHEVVVHRSNIVRGEGDCAECGKPIGTGYSHREFKECCFTCSCWRVTLASDLAAERPFAVVEGEHYTFDDATEGRRRGSAGRAFVVLFTDGRVATTQNLWNQGPIPEHFRSRLPDNARSIVPTRMREHSHA